MNKNILGGWKYVNNKTGEFFTDENDIEKSAKLLLDNLDNYSPRQYMIYNYGPVNSGKKLKEFLFKNFKDRLNVKEPGVKYVTIMSPLTVF